ncbi:MAG: carbon monoxide dehydrogenase subunit G [Anaerolineales bacterium]
MKVEGEHLFKGPPQQVWDLFRDTDVMAAALPGTEKMESVGDNKYEAIMNVRVGPVTGEFSGNLVISNEKFPESYTMTVDGRGKPGFLKGSGDITLLDQGESGTLMKYVGEVQIGGKLAGVGQRLIDTVSKSIISQAFETLDRVLEERSAAEVEDREVEYQGASEKDYAAAIAKDMVGGLLSTSWAKWLIGVVILVIIGIILIISYT